ncbi:MAG: ComEC/Rec2 family competence protein [Brevinema sp.]
MRTNVILSSFPEPTAEGIAVRAGAMIVRMPDNNEIALGAGVHLKGKLYPKSKTFYADEATVLRPAPKIWQTISRWRLSAQKKVRDMFSPQSASLILALSFGNKEFLDPLFEEYIRSSGMSHFLALSGLHVGLIAGIAFGILLKLGVQKRIAPLGALPFSLAYLMMGGLRAPLMRAVLFHVFWVLNALSRWNIHPAMVLAISFVLLLGLGMGGVSLMMSVMAVAGILFLSSFWDESLTFLLGSYWGGIISISLAATLGVLPIVLLFFKEINVLFLLPNLVILPLAPIIVLLCVLATLFPLPLWEKPVSICYYMMENTCRIVAETPYSLLRVSSTVAMIVMVVGWLMIIIKKYSVYRRVRNGL